MKTKTCALLALAFLLPGSTAVAARVANLYAAQVPLESGSEALRDAFDAALAQVLVKVTGRRELAATEGLAARLGEAEKFVQQYRINADDEVWISFDEVALRRELDGVGEPVWGVERPATLVWLVLDEGLGERRILGGMPDAVTGSGALREVGPDTGRDAGHAGLIREELIATAAARGLPLIQPLVDSQEVASISLRDVWGGFFESLVSASRRYGPDAVLIGRVRAGKIGGASVRWTLLLDDERFDWEGGVASGADDVADFFAARLATSSDASSGIVLSVEDVDSFDAYGRLTAYLAGLDIVETFSVDQVSDDRVTFQLQVRGDADRLMRSIALQRVLLPIAETVAAPGGSPFGIPPAARNLRYKLMAGS
ncbi:MAG: DUF2066 domain-containing protein [Gammaproteobacteria bacterium]